MNIYKQYIPCVGQVIYVCCLPVLAHPPASNNNKYNHNSSKYKYPYSNKYPYKYPYSTPHNNPHDSAASSSSNSSSSESELSRLLHKHPYSSTQHLLSESATNHAPRLEATV